MLWILGALDTIQSTLIQSRTPVGHSGGHSHSEYRDHLLKRRNAAVDVRYRGRSVSTGDSGSMVPVSDYEPHRVTRHWLVRWHMLLNSAAPLPRPVHCMHPRVPPGPLCGVARCIEPTALLKPLCLPVLDKQLRNLCQCSIVYSTCAALTNYGESYFQ